MKKQGAGKATLEMLRSFCAMASDLNLSRAAQRLGLTRQTIRRHIQLMEKSRGEKLFELRNKTYFLTDAGRNALAAAESITAEGMAWLHGQYDIKDGLQHVRIRTAAGEPHFLSSQHELTRIWRDGEPILQQALQCWCAGKGAIESREFAPVRPYILVFRRFRNEWLCSEIGEKSALAIWYGWEWAKSSIGRPVEDIPASDAHSEYILDAYEKVRCTGAPRLDHQFRFIARKSGGRALPMAYQRLLLASRFPDGGPALVSVVKLTDAVDIAGLEQKFLKKANPV